MRRSGDLACYGIERDDEDGICYQCGEVIEVGTLCESCRWDYEHTPPDDDEPTLHAGQEVGKEGNANG